MKERSICVIGAFLILVGCGRATPRVVEQYIHCRSLAGDRTALKVFEWEFNAVSEAINSCCTPEKELTAKQIIAAVSKQLKPEVRGSLKNLESSVTLTLLELEVRGVYTKTAGSSDDKYPKYRRTN